MIVSHVSTPHRPTVQTVPAALRFWFADIQQPDVVAAIQAYTTQVEAPQLIQHELMAAEALKDSSLQITASGAAQEVVAAIQVDDGTKLELSIQMPTCFPLQPAEVLPLPNAARVVSSPEQSVVCQDCLLWLRDNKCRLFLFFNISFSS
jgi:hypothetical protein